MSRRTTATTGFALAWALTAAVPLTAQSTGPSHAGYDPNASVGAHYHDGDIGEKLMVLERALRCTCSCGLDVHSCQFQMQCAYSPVWSRRIRESLEAGQDVDVIQASFVAEFGPRVLMAPPPEGFNLVGYLMPAMVIVSAGMLVGLIARGGTSRSVLTPIEELSDEDSERLREALDRLDETESPDW